MKTMDSDEFRNSVRDFVDLHASKYEEAKEKLCDRDLATDFAVQYLAQYSNKEEYNVSDEFSSKFKSENIEAAVGREVALRVLNDEEGFLKATTRAEFEFVTEIGLTETSSKILSSVYDRLSEITQEGVDGLYDWYLSGFSHAELSSLERNFTRVVDFENVDAILKSIEDPSEAKDAIELYSSIVDVVDTGSPLLLAVQRAENGNIDHTINLVGMNFGHIYSELDRGRYSKIVSLINRNIRNGIKHGDARVLPAESIIRIDNKNKMSYEEFKNYTQEAYICCEVVYGLPGIIGAVGYERTDMDASVDF